MDRTSIATAILGKSGACDQGVTHLRTPHKASSQRHLSHSKYRRSLPTQRIKNATQTVAATTMQVDTERRIYRTNSGNSTANSQRSYFVARKECFGNKTTGRERLGTKTARPALTEERLGNKTTRRSRLDDKINGPLSTKECLGVEINRSLFTDASCTRNYVTTETKQSGAGVKTSIW